MAGDCGGTKIPSLPDKILNRVVPHFCAPRVSLPALLWGGVRVTLDLLCPHWFLTLKVRQPGALKWYGNKSLRCLVRFQAASFQNPPEPLDDLRPHECRIPTLPWYVVPVTADRPRGCSGQRFGHSGTQPQWLSFPWQRGCHLRGFGSPAAALLLLMPVTS